MSTSPDSAHKIEQSFNIPASVNQAFDVFVKELNSWWPKEYTWAGDTLEKIAIESGVNGRCFERGPHGFECDWGRVLIWEPPQRIVFTWQISPDRVPEPNPEKASEIEVLFKGDDEKTKVEFIHKNFENHGENAEAYKKALQSPKGWTYILSNYKKAIS